MENKIHEQLLEPGSIVTARDIRSGEEVKIRIHHPRAETGDGLKILASLDGNGKRILVLKPELLLEGGIIGHLRFPGLADCEAKIDSSL